VLGGIALQKLHAGGNNRPAFRFFCRPGPNTALGCFTVACMNGLIYLVGLIVVVMAILSLLGLKIVATNAQLLQAPWAQKDHSFEGRQCA
jgi:hypothetical protein